MFQPELTLIPQVDGTFTLLVRALVPTSCYIAGQLTEGFPPGMSGIPEARPYTFEIKHVGGIFCLEYVHYVSAAVQGIKPDPGHNYIAVFSSLNGRVVGEATISLPDVEKLRGVLQAAPAAGAIIPGTVHATVFSSIIGPQTLRVTALVATPTPGYKADLIKATPQGINPTILLLQLRLTPPTGPVIQIPSTVLAEYEDKPYTGDFSDVTILNGAQIVTVPIIVILSLADPKARRNFSTMRR
jgi:hypothetical protein